MFSKILSFTLPTPQEIKASEEAKQAQLIEDQLAVQEKNEKLERKEAEALAEESLKDKEKLIYTLNEVLKQAATNGLIRSSGFTLLNFFRSKAVYLDYGNGLEPHTDISYLLNKAGPKCTPENLSIINSLLKDRGWIATITNRETEVDFSMSSRTSYYSSVHDLEIKPLQKP